jgi:hypothetical protein
MYLLYQNFSLVMFFNKKAVFILLGWTLFISCASQANNENKSGSAPDSTNKVKEDHVEVVNKADSLNKLDTFFTPERKMIEIDKELEHMEKVNGFIQFDWQKDTLKLELYLEKGRPAKLTYTTFDDGGIASGLGAYYFDSLGKVFANKLYYENKEVVEAYLGNHEVLKYDKNGEIHLLQMNKEAQLYREAISVKTLDDFMMVLNIFNYTAPKPSSNAWAILKVKESLKLYESPNEKSRVLLTLNKSTSLKYLGNNRKQDVVGELTWAWYHVSTEKGVKGWVFGHPDLISEQNDETD